MSLEPDRSPVLRRHRLRRWGSARLGIRAMERHRRPGPAAGSMVLAALLGVLGIWSLRSHEGAAKADVAATAPRSVSWMGRTMGTYDQVVLVTDDSTAMAPIAGRAQAEFVRIDSLMSNWTKTSEVARINRVAASGATPAQAEVATVLATAVRVWKETDGAMDITVEPLVRAWGFLGGPKRVPTDAEAAAAFAKVGGSHLHFDQEAGTVRFDRAGMQIDLGGIAKGYAVDAAAAQVRNAGVKDALINVSGNMLALGAPPGSTAWRIGIRDPRDRVEAFARLRLSGEGVSTSGKYEQFVAANGKTYGHIIDPRTGTPAEGLISVTVVAPTAMDADAWDTGLFVLGADAAKRKAKERKDVAVVLVEPGANGVDTVWVEKQLQDRFTLEPKAREFFHVEYF